MIRATEKTFRDIIVIADDDGMLSEVKTRCTEHLAEIKIERFEQGYIRLE